MQRSGGSVVLGLLEDGEDYKGQQEMGLGISRHEVRI